MTAETRICRVVKPDTTWYFHQLFYKFLASEKVLWLVQEIPNFFTRVFWWSQKWNQLIIVCTKIYFDNPQLTTTISPENICSGWFRAFPAGSLWKQGTSRTYFFWVVLASLSTSKLSYCQFAVVFVSQKCTGDPDSDSTAQEHYLNASNSVHH